MFTDYLSKNISPNIGDENASSFKNALNSFVVRTYLRI